MKKDIWKEEYKITAKMYKVNIYLMYRRTFIDPIVPHFQKFQLLPGLAEHIGVFTLNSRRVGMREAVDQIHCIS